MAKLAMKTKARTNGPLLLTYRLVDLPSAQHRSGLAGLVLMLEFLSRQPGPRRGIARVARLHAFGADVELDSDGLAELFDVTYRTALGERPEPKIRKDKAKRDVTPIRSEESVEIDPKTKKEKAVTRHFYPEYVPDGAFLLELDPAAVGGKGPWIKLWRDMIWSIPRGVPATRGPFEDRAANLPTTDAAVAWTDLINATDGKRSVDLSSALFLGAQECTAEGVPFLDRAAQKLLLHFSLFIAQVYVPELVNAEGKGEFSGYAIVFPDIRDLQIFCDELPVWLRERGPEVRGFRPRGAIVDLPEVGALDIQAGLIARLGQRLQTPALTDLLLGFDVLHLVKEGNNIRLRSWTRVPIESAAFFDEFRPLRDLWCPLFRRQRMRNLLAGARRWAGFDRLISTTSADLTFDDSAFRHDAREFFQLYQPEPQERFMSDDDPTTPAEPEVAALVYQAARNYVSRRVEQKHDLSWDKVKEDPKAVEAFRGRRKDVARSAFLAARSRTGADFVEFFAATICSVPQRSKGGEKGFAALSRALLQDTDTVRTLTLLALSANS